MKLEARECLLIFGVALLFAMSQLAPQDVGVLRYIGVTAIGAVWTLTAALLPERWSRGRD